MSEPPEDPESEPPETSVAQRGVNFMLSYAARAGDYDVVAHALTLGGDPNYGRDFTFSPLHGALVWAWPQSCAERVDIVRHLLEHGADPNIRDREGYTPLYRAIEKGIAAAVILLIEWGADVNTVDLSGRSAIDIAFQDRKIDIAILLRERYPELFTTWTRA